MNHECFELKVAVWTSESPLQLPNWCPENQYLSPLNDLRPLHGNIPQIPGLCCWWHCPVSHCAIPLHEPTQRPCTLPTDMVTVDCWRIVKTIYVGCKWLGIESQNLLTAWCKGCSWTHLGSVPGNQVLFLARQPARNCVRKVASNFCNFQKLRNEKIAKSGKFGKSIASSRPRVHHQGSTGLAICPGPTWGKLRSPISEGEGLTMHQHGEVLGLNG